MKDKIKAKIVNGAQVPLVPLGIEEGANVVFKLVSQSPPGFGAVHAGLHRRP